MPSVEIRQIKSLADFESTIELQRKIWEYSDLEAESQGILTVASRFAGQVLGAFLGSQLVGFALAFVGIEPYSMHSHRVGVLPNQQNTGIGLALKLAQREYALKQGYRCIHWTFDPLQPRNAYFNLHKLGGQVRTIFPNLYGTTNSPLQGGLPTDRLLLDWSLPSQRVLDALSGRPVVHMADVKRIPLIARPDYSMSVNQQLLRERLQETFSEGMVLTDFEIRGNSAEYIAVRL